MSITFNALRQVAGKKLIGRPRYVIGTATAASTSNNTLTDAIHLKSAARSPWHKGAYLLRPEQNTTDRVRQIQEDSYLQGTVQLTPDYSLPVANGEAYEIWPFGYDPITTEEAINDAMMLMGIPDEIVITPVAGQRQYPLAAYPWLTSTKQVESINWLDGATGQQVPYPVPDFSVTNDLGTLTLNLLGDTFGSTDVVQMKVWRSAYSTGSVTPLVAGTDTVTLPNMPDYLTYVALLTCLELLSAPYARRFGPRAEKDRQAVLADLRTQIRPYLEKFGPSRSWQLFRPITERW